jgi:hypothetical protein
MSDLSIQNELAKVVRTVVGTTPETSLKANEPFMKRVMKHLWAPDSQIIRLSTSFSNNSQMPEKKAITEHAQALNRLRSLGISPRVVAEVIIRFEKLVLDLLEGISNRDKKIQELNEKLADQLSMIEKLKSRRAISGKDTAIDGDAAFVVTAKLLELQRQGKLPEYVAEKGRNAKSPDIWIRETLGSDEMKGVFSANEIALAISYPAVWHRVDFRLYNVKKTRLNRAKIANQNQISVTGAFQQNLLAA